jgi:carbon storage regulator
MINRADETRREKIGFQFLTALDDGDLDMLASLWELAADDAELSRMFCELSDAVYDEEVGRTEAAGLDLPLARVVPGPGPSAVMADPMPSSVPGKGGALVLTRKLDEQIVIGDNIMVTVIKIDRQKVRLAITAPTSVPVYRREVYDVIHRDSTPIERGLPHSEE